MNIKYKTKDRVGIYEVIERCTPYKIKCRCTICGKISVVNITNIRRNKMCRFCRTNNNIKPKENLIGKKFGRLTVTECIAEGGHIKWKCICDCGKLTVVSTCHLKSGHTQSCGCLMRERTAQANLINLTNMRFGRLVVIKKAEGYTVPSGQTLTNYICKCDCGAETKVLAMNLLSGNTQSCGCIGYSLGENKIQKWLIDNNIEFTKEFSFSDLRSRRGGLLRFDFALWNKGQLQCVIEFNGEQHYYEDNKNKFGKQQREETDNLKKVYCEEHNIKLYIIRFDENIEAKLEEILSEY